MMRTLIPKKLSRGDCIGIVAPAGPIADAAKIESGVRYLESLGYRTLVGKHVYNRDGYLAGTDSERAADLSAMFLNPQVRAILCARGGYGTPRLLPLLDFGLIRRHPKILVGFSDITALQLAIWKKCGLVTFHGPMLVPDFSGTIRPVTEESFWRTVTSSLTPDPIRLTGTVLHDGIVVGRLLGGNLSLVASLAGTPYLPDFRNALLVIEEIGEEPYRVDRMLRQLAGTGILRHSAGFIGGQFTECVPEDPAATPRDCTSLIEEAAREVEGPALSNVSVGHVPEKMTLPVGIRARLDAGRQELRLLSSPVR